MDLSKACKQLIIKDPYYGLFLLRMSKRYSNAINTLAVGVEGVNICLYINNDYWDSLSDSEQIALLKHELMHICLDHLFNYNHLPNARVANIAMDCEVNQFIPDLPNDGITLDGLEDKLGIKLQEKAGTNYYYNKIIENINEPEMPDPLCSHDMWKEIKDMSSAEQEVVKNQINNNMMEAAKELKKNRGSLPGELKDKIERLFATNPPIFNWKSYFRRLIGFSFDVTTKKSRRKFSKRFPDANGIKIKKKHRLLVGIDTSGSVSKDELAEFFVEIQRIYKAGATIKILECDYIINSEYEYKGKTPDFITGRGGTRFDPVIEYYNNRRNEFSELIYFTDGECSLDVKPHKNVIWVISSNGSTLEKLPGIVIKIPKKINE